jgi:iron(III) transport system permease protein
MTSTGIAADASSGTFERQLRRFEPIQLVWAIVTISVVAMVAVPVGYLVYSAFMAGGAFTFAEFTAAVTSAGTVTALVNTLVYVTGTTIISVLIGVPMAFMVERTNVSLVTKRVVRLTIIASVITPGFLSAMSYVNLLGPNAGIINVWLRELLNLDINRGPLNIFSLPAVLLLGAHSGIAYIYLITAASFSKMNPEFEEAAQITGASRWRIVRTVSLPLVRNAVFSGALVSMVSSFADYGTPHMVNYTVLTLRIREYIIRADFAGAASASLLLIALSLILLGIYRLSIRKGDFATVSGKSFQPRTFDIGAWKHVIAVLVWIFAILAVILPIAGLFSTSILDRLGYGLRWDNLTLRHYISILSGSDSFAITAFLNSLFLATGAAVITSIMSVVIGYITVRYRTGSAKLLDYISIIPLGLAGTALAVALVLTALNPPLRALGLYGTLWILLIAYVIRNFPLALRPVQTTMSQISPELEEAARMSGAGWLRTMRTVTMPLILPGVAAGFVLVFLGSLTEISASVVLRHIGTNTISTAILDIWEGRGGFQAASAVAVILFVLMVAVVFLAQLLSGGRMYSTRSAGDR